jgi:hypothetical protein
MKRSLSPVSFSEKGPSLPGLVHPKLLSALAGLSSGLQSQGPSSSAHHLLIPFLLLILESQSSARCGVGAGLNAFGPVSPEPCLPHLPHKWEQLPLVQEEGPAAEGEERTDGRGLGRRANQA